MRAPHRLPIRSSCLRARIAPKRCAQRAIPYTDSDCRVRNENRGPDFLDYRVMRVEWSAFVTFSRRPHHPTIGESQEIEGILPKILCDFLQRSFYFQRAT